MTFLAPLDQFGEDKKKEQKELETMCESNVDSWVSGS
jgi:hypothetical protein